MWKGLLFFCQCNLKEKNSETSGNRMEEFNSCEQQQAMSLTQGAGFDDGHHHPHNGHDNDDGYDSDAIHN
jgi:hypothetical protein